MALKRCRECRRPVSTEAQVCPHCGVPNPIPPPKQSPRGKGHPILKLMAVLALAVTVVSLMSHAENARAARDEAAAEARAKAHADSVRDAREDSLRSRLANRRGEVFGYARRLSEEDSLATAQRFLDQFAFIGDSGVKALRDSIQEQVLLERVQKLPASNAQANASVYAQLAELRPGVARYKERARHYSEIVKRQKAAAAAQKAFLGPKPVASAWDGSYPEVTDYLKAVANDPSSIKIESCTPVYEVKKEGWLVGCTYRGKNAFGGMIRTANWFIIRQGRVVKMADADAYTVH